MRPTTLANATLAEPDPPPFDHEGAASPHTPSPHTPTPHTHSPTLNTLYRRHAAWLSTLLKLRYGRDAAEDLLQETFLRAVASGKADAVRHPRAWLLTIALNAARDLHRRQSVRPRPATPDEALLLDSLPSGSTQDEALLLKQVILALPPPLKEVFLLSRFGGLTNSEIARRLNISIKTVEWRMTRALAICAAKLSD